MFHSVADCNHSYSTNANHSFATPCNASYMSELIHTRLKRLRLNAEMTQQDVADVLGISRVAVSKWESGQTKDLKNENLRGLARLYQVSLEELLTGDGPMRDATKAHHALDASQIGTPIITWDKPEDLPEGEFVIVPRYDLHVAAGNGHVVYEEIEHEQGQAYRTNSIRRLGTMASNLMTVYAKGDSMEPSIYAGDALLVDRGQREVQDRNVYVLRYGHEIRVKRLFRRPDGGLRIVSDNTNGFPEEVVTATEMEHIEIIGRVVERSGRM